MGNNTENMNADTELDQLMSDVDEIDAGGEVEDDESNAETQQPATNDEQNSTESTEDVEDDMQNVIKPKRKSTKQAKTEDKVDNTAQQVKHNPQDLLDAEGNVIAKAGAERRFYEEAQRLRRDQLNFKQNVLPQIKEQYNLMENQLNAYKQVVDGFKASDLSPQDIQAGFDFVRQWKKNPQDVVKFLLTNLQSSGINIDIEGMTPSINAESIKQMLDAKLQPFIQEREQRVEAQQREAEVTNEYNNFINKYPDSRVHDKTLAFMIRNDASLTPELAYYKLKNFYLQKGLDFRVPLEELAQQKQQPNVQQGIPQAPNVSENVVKNTNGQQHVAGVNVGFKDIVHQAMAEAGLK